jgi:hypothetical protein
LAQAECQYLATMGRGPAYLEDVKSLEAKCSPAERKLLPLGRPRDDLMAQVRGTPRESEFLAALIVYAWRIHNVRYPWLRPWILAIYSLGFLLLGIPAAATFVQVTLAGLRSWFR